MRILVNCTSNCLKVYEVKAACVGGYVTQPKATEENKRPKSKIVLILDFEVRGEDEEVFINMNGHSIEECNQIIRNLAASDGCIDLTMYGNACIANYAEDINENQVELGYILDADLKNFELADADEMYVCGIKNTPWDPEDYTVEYDDDDEVETPIVENKQESRFQDLYNDHDTEGATGLFGRLRRK